MNINISRFVKKTRCYSTSSIPAVPVMLCKNCIHYKPGDLDYILSVELKKSPLYQKYVSEYGTCRRFGELNLVSGEIKLEYASIARLRDTMCGYNAHFYEEKEKTIQDDCNYKNKKYDESPLS